MYTKTRTANLVSGIALSVLALGSASAADTMSQDVTEARQEAQIWTTYALNPHLRANDLKVSVDDGKATLSGVVGEDISKELAKQIALGVSGVTAVDNQILVKTDYAAPKPKAGSDRGYGEIIDDATITSTVKSKMLWSKHTDGLSINVDTMRGKVTLKGDADSATSKDLATRLAMNTRGVETVDNQLKIRNAKPAAADSAKQAVGAAEQNVSDGWITTKVKSTFTYSSNVDASDISVSTASGVVSLSGKVDSGVERALAIELANNVRGVKSVESKGLTVRG